MVNDNCKKARTFIKETTRTQYENTVYEAKLTPEQKEILDLHILEARSIVSIAMKLHCTTTHVTEKLRSTYKSIYSVMKSTLN